MENRSNVPNTSLYYLCTFLLICNYFKMKHDNKKGFQTPRLETWFLGSSPGSFLPFPEVHPWPSLGLSQPICEMGLGLMSQAFKGLCLAEKPSVPRL